MHGGNGWTGKQIMLGDGGGFGANSNEVSSGSRRLSKILTIKMYFYSLSQVLKNYGVSDLI